MANPYQDVIGNKGKKYIQGKKTASPGKAWYEGKGKGQDQGSPYGGYEESASKWYAPWTWGSEKKTWRPDPGAYRMEKGVPDWAQLGAQQMAQKRAGQDMRARSEQSMDYMRRVMSGQESAARHQAQLGLQSGMQDIAARAGSMQRGGYDPATARAALLAQEQMGANVAGKAALAAAQERQAAATGYAQAAQAARGLDVQQMVSMEQLAQQYRQMGMTDKYNELMSRIQWDRAKMAGFFGEQVSGEGGFQFLGQLAGGVAGAFSGDPEVAKLGAQAGRSFFTPPGSK